MRNLLAQQLQVGWIKCILNSKLGPTQIFILDHYLVRGDI